MHAQQLFTRVRDDLKASAADQKFADSQIYRYLDRAYKKVWGEQITLFESWQVKRATVDLVSGTELYALPLDLKKLILVEYLYNGNYYPLDLVDYAEQYKLKQVSTAINGVARYYYLLDAQVGILPLVSATATAGLRITYYPKAGALHAGTLTGVAGGGPTTTVTLATDASAEDDEYNGQMLGIYEGAGSVQKAQITDYVGSTKVATVVFATAPNTSSKYALYPKSESELDELIVLQACVALTLIQDPTAHRAFAEMYARERARRIDEMARRNTAPQYLRFIDVNGEA